MRTLLTLALSVPLCACFFVVKEGPPEHVHVAAARTSEASGASEASAPRASSASVASSATGKVFPYAVQQKTLSNGLKAIVVPMPSDGLVSYWSIVRTGSRDEVEPGVTGFAHFFEHMMFRGTEKHPEYDRVTNGIGADANAFTSRDITAYHLSFAKDDLATVVDVEADRFQNLKYDEAQFRTEAGAVYGEYRKNRTSPFAVLNEAQINAAFEVHTYKHTTIGFEADIQKMPEQYEYSQGFFQRFYRPENVVLFVVGDVDPAATFALIEKSYAGWKKGYVAPKVPSEPPQTAQRRLDVAFEGKTLPILSVAFKGERFLPRDRRMLAGQLLGELAFGETSALYKKLVLEEQRVERLSGGFGSSRDPSLWSVIAMVKDVADAPAIEGEIWDTIQRFQREPVAMARLDEIRSREKYGFLTGLATPDGVANSVAYEIAMTGGLEWIEEQYGTLEQVTPEDVRAAAQQWLRPESSTVALLHAKDAPAAAAVLAARPVLFPVAQDPNVVFKLWFQVGSQDDPSGKEGLANLVGDLLSEGGTKSKSYDEILQALFPLAAGYGVAVDKEMTVVTGVVHRDKAAEFYALFSDALLNPGFRAEDFERLRDANVNALENSLRFSSDEELGKASLVARVFRGTRYAHPALGTVQSLKALTLEDVRSFWSAHFTQSNVVLALGGAYDEKLQARVQADLARLPSGTPVRASAPAIEPLAGRHALIVEKPGPSTAISFGFPIDVHRGSREFYALWLANSWLGEHRNSSSHLYQVIRAARGINYGNYSYIEAFPHGGQREQPPTGVGRRAQLFEVWIRPVPEERAVFALRAGLREVEQLVANGMTKEQFEFTRSFLKKYCLHFAEDTEARLGYAVDDRFYGLDEPHLARFRRLLDDLTLAEVNAALKKHLKLDDVAFAFVTAHADKLKDALTSGAPSPIDYGTVPKPPEILAEDKLIERYPLGIPAANVQLVPVTQMFEGRAIVGVPAGAQ
ncbi:MAG: insulinase family protein [Planctomycetes bacterium]|nr:insulinase family protein [Planctomycetota bacterium]